MQITIDVDELKCARCGTTAPLLPHLLFIEAQIPAGVRHGLGNLFRGELEIGATDTAGRNWRVFSEQKPHGWASGPAGADLCTPCSKLWEASGRMFLTTPPPAPVKKTFPTPETFLDNVFPKKKSARREKLAAPRFNPGSSVPLPELPVTYRKPRTLAKTKKAARKVSAPFIPRPTHGSSVVPIDHSPKRKKR